MDQLRATVIKLRHGLEDSFDAKDLGRRWTMGGMLAENTMELQLTLIRSKAWGITKKEAVKLNRLGALVMSEFLLG